MERRASSTSDVVGQQSLLTALNRFVLAVNAMDDIVMIPSRLRDLEVTVPEMQEENNNISDDKAVAIPSFRSGMDLYRCFSMLHVIRDEIIDGSKEEEDQSGASGEVEDDSENDETAASRKTANMFRYHLRGLFRLLHQLTATAQYLGSRYERDVTQNQPTFSLNM
ncbi:mid1-interacting protein 1A-like [Babylonia areolata]|uniref:mid1-interacting protein 1A-like n=1 Tax=Babylonia areolata TaxID=304850 RepID=UPI003FCF169D